MPGCPVYTMLALCWSDTALIVSQHKCHQQLEQSFRKKLLRDQNQFLRNCPIPNLRIATIYHFNRQRIGQLFQTFPSAKYSAFHTKVQLDFPC